MSMKSDSSKKQPIEFSLQDSFADLRCYLIYSIISINYINLLKCI